ncbi:MAG: 2-oxoacid:acceptor oxidoreductase family protein [Synergistota bacterium]|nr:2-oxoacid:acceptor oxidoreductase family protein [Synergistota bacterium]
MQYVICGIGGQGILFATKVLGHVALSRGEHVTGSEVHGMSQRGGSVISHFKTGDSESPLVCAGEADVLLAFDQKEALKNYHFLRPGGCAVVNAEDTESLGEPNLAQFVEAMRLDMVSVPGYDILDREMDGRFLFLNSLMLGALCGAPGGGVSPGDARAAIDALSPERFRNDNLQAFDLGLASATH